jgi:hypothetical protein NreA
MRMSHVSDPGPRKRLRRTVVKALEKARQFLIIDNHLGAGDSDLPVEVKDKLSVFREITKYL